MVATQPIPANQRKLGSLKNASRPFMRPLAPPAADWSRSPMEADELSVAESSSALRSFEGTGGAEPIELLSSGCADEAGGAWLVDVASSCVRVGAIVLEGDVSCCNNTLFDVASV